MLQAIADIELHLEGRTEEDVDRDRQAAQAVLWNFVVLGEAANAIPQEIKDATPEIPWRKIRGMRNVIAHQYFAVRLSVVWDTAVEELPAVKQALTELLSAHPPGNG